MVYTLPYCCFKICSDWTKFHEEISFLEQVFLKSRYPLSFIDNCFKTFVDELVIKHPQLITVEKKTLCLSLPYLGETSLQTRTKLILYLPHYELTLGESVFYVFLKVNSPNNDIEK